MKKQYTTKIILKEGYSVRTYHLQDKKYRIMNDVFRNKLRKYDRVSDMVSGLANYRILNIC
ncbi:hypothetical protein BH23THE1_BH23THE1_22770 [soil metagenome]